MLKPLFLELRGVLFDWDGKQSSYLLGTRSGEKATVWQGRSRRGRSSRGPTKTNANIKLEANHQSGNASTSTNRTEIDLYCDRLISRAEEVDDILDKFAIVIKSFFDKYIRDSDSNE
ncbi:hypothetical protein IWQ61_004257 [Dispira simplex]|nr:hypothetical protein IWQ61_004257 [Dispira simplex]